MSLGKCDKCGTTTRTKDLYDEGYRDKDGTIIEYWVCLICHDEYYDEAMSQIGDY